MSKKARVKWLDKLKGYGFLADEESGDETFVLNFPFDTDEGAIVDTDNNGQPAGDSERVPSPGANKPTRRSLWRKENG